MISALALTIVVPLSGALIAFLVAGRAGRALSVLTGAATVAAVLMVTAAVWTAGPLRYEIGGWSAPLGIELRADGLSAAMLVMSGIISVTILAYGLGHYPPTRDSRGWRPEESFWSLILFLWAALNALFLSADVFNLYVALELMSVAAVAQVTLAEDREALPAAMRYLVAAFLGSLAYLLGVALLYAELHVLDLAALGASMTASPATRAAAALMTVGLALKCAVFPLHFWLPRAHSIAPAPVSAALSALVVTASYYVLLRLWTTVFPAVLTPVATQALGAVGAAGIVYGSLQAIRQPRLKLIVSYSTIAQTGYLFLLLPLLLTPAAVVGGAPTWSADAWGGGIYHAVSHAFAKAAMFLAAGGIVQALGDDNIVGIRGIAEHLPISTYAFGIAGLSLVGIPPTGGFVSKWLLLLSAIQSGQWWWAVVLLLGGLLTAAYIFQVLTQELSLAGSESHPDFAPVPLSMELAAMALAVGSLLLGLRATEPLRLLEIGSPAASALLIGTLQ